MKATTLTKNGIRMEDGVIVVGESGRGRHMVKVPVPQNAELVNRSQWSGAEIIDPAGRVVNERSGDADSWVAEYATAHAAKIGGTVRRVPHYSATLISVTVPGEQPGELLVFVPDMSGFRGESSISKMEGCQVVARGRRAEGDAGAMGGGAEYLLRIANGGSFTVARSGRRLEWGVGVYTNVNGTLVFRDPAKEAKVAEASASLLGMAPVISPEIAKANLEREAALRARDEAAAQAAEAVKRGVEAVRAETAALWREVSDYQQQAAEVRHLEEARAAKAKAAAELGNGFAGAFAALGL